MKVRLLDTGHLQHKTYRYKVQVCKFYCWWHTIYSTDYKQNAIDVFTETLPVQILMEKVL